MHGWAGWSASALLQELACEGTDLPVELSSDAWPLRVGQLDGELRAVLVPWEAWARRGRAAHQREGRVRSVPLPTQGVGLVWVAELGAETALAVVPALGGSAWAARPVLRAGEGLGEQPAERQVLVVPRLLFGASSFAARRG